MLYFINRTFLDPKFDNADFTDVNCCRRIVGKAQNGGFLETAGIIAIGKQSKYFIYTHTRKHADCKRGKTCATCKVHAAVPRSLPFLRNPHAALHLRKLCNGTTWPIIGTDATSGCPVAHARTLTRLQRMDHV